MVFSGRKTGDWRCGMKYREVIETSRTMTLQELFDFMEQHWDKESCNDFVIGRPGVGAFEDYIMLPATPHCAVCICTRKGRVILTVMSNSAGQKALAGSLALGGYGRMGMVGEMNGVASQANALYAAYLESLFAEEGMLSGEPKRKKPVLRQADQANGSAAGKLLDLVKIAPPQARGISILSFVLGLISLFIFFTGIPGLLLGIVTIILAGSVLKNQGFQPQAYTGQFLAKIAVCMSAVVAFLTIVGGILTSLHSPYK